MAMDIQHSELTAAQPVRGAKNRRIAVRVTDHLADQLEQAVVLSGRSKTDLITEAIADKAHAVVREQRLLELTDRDMDALLAVIASPPRPNEAMQRSVARWRQSSSLE
jgi:uncharacterized protein (DUF1778 family)